MPTSWKKSTSENNPWIVPLLGKVILAMKSFLRNLRNQQKSLKPNNGGNTYKKEKSNMVTPSSQKRKRDVSELPASKKGKEKHLISDFPITSFENKHRLKMNTEKNNKSEYDEK